MRILLTGATGFVGAELKKSFSEEDLILYSRRPIDGKSEFRLLGSIQKDDFKVVLRDVDVVVHLAGLAHQKGRGGLFRDNDFYEVNTVFTERLARAAASAGVKHFIFMSTIKVNGENTSSDSKFKATDEPAPTDVYARSKLEAEQHLFRISAESRMVVSVVRPPLVYGPGARANFGSLMKMSKYAVIFPTGKNVGRRSLVSIWNLCSLIKHLVDCVPSESRIYLVSDDSDCTIFELISFLRTALAMKTFPVSLNLNLLYCVFRMLKLEVYYNKLFSAQQIDISDTMRILNWKPIHTTKAGIAETVSQRTMIVRDKQNI